MPILPLTLKEFLGKFGPFIAVALLMAAILALAYCNGRSAGAQKEINAEQGRTIKVQTDNAKANEQADLDRAETTAKITEQKKELDDAVARHEDADTLRKRRGCLVRLQQGRDTTRIPECQRFAAER